MRAGASQAETQVVVAVVRRGVVTIRRTAVPRVVVPVTTTFDAVRARIGTHIMATPFYEF